MCALHWVSEIAEDKRPPLHTHCLRGFRDLWRANPETSQMGQQGHREILSLSITDWDQNPGGNTGKASPVFRSRPERGGAVQGLPVSRCKRNALAVFGPYLPIDFGSREPWREEPRVPFVPALGAESGLLVPRPLGRPPTASHLPLLADLRATPPPCLVQPPRNQQGCAHRSQGSHPVSHYGHGSVFIFFRLFTAHSRS